MTYTLGWQGAETQEGPWRTVPGCRSRFPVGTKFVIEGRRGGEGQGQVYSRYLEFPDGTFFPLPARPVRPSSSPWPPRRQAPGGAGTASRTATS